MSDAVITVLANGVFAVLLAWMNRRMQTKLDQVKEHGEQRAATLKSMENKLDDNTVKTVETKEIATTTATAVNGRLEELLKAKYSEGVTAGQDEMRQMLDQQHRHHQANIEHIRKLEEAIAEIKKTKGVTP